MFREKKHEDKGEGDDDGPDEKRHSDCMAVCRNDDFSLRKGEQGYLLDALFCQSACAVPGSGQGTRMQRLQLRGHNGA